MTFGAESGLPEDTDSTATQAGPLNLESKHQEVVLDAKGALTKHHASVSDLGEDQVPEMKSLG